jgi:hypothetical protein
VKIRLWLIALLEKIAKAFRWRFRSFHAAGFRVDGATGSSSPAE